MVEPITCSITLVTLGLVGLIQSWRIYRSENKISHIEERNKKANIEINCLKQGGSCPYEKTPLTEKI